MKNSVLAGQEKKRIIAEIEGVVKNYDESAKIENIRKYSTAANEAVRRCLYLYLGKLYRENPDLREKILKLIKKLLWDDSEHVRGTAVYALGEIELTETELTYELYETALNDKYQAVKDAIIEVLQKKVEKDPVSTLQFARRFLYHSNPRIRRGIIHGIEPRGRTHPEDILPFLEEFQDDPDKKLRGTILYVLGEISYKKGCLEKVAAALKRWTNRELVFKALKEILEVHKRYEKFSAKSFKETKEYLEKEFGKI